MLTIAPLGAAPGAVLESVEQALAGAFRLPVACVPALAEPLGAFSEERNQWSAVAFLEALLAQAPAGAERLLGLTERDLFVPVLSFVFGQAQLRGRVAVVSLARLRPEFHGLSAAPAALRRRAATEAVHELGHTFGLVHCPDGRCPMSLSIDLAGLDGKSAVPCPGCAALLEGGREMRQARALSEGDRS